MTRYETLEILRDFKRDFSEQYGIVELGVFGSYARDEAREDSDVDVVFQARQPNLFQTVRIKEALERALVRHVDVVRWREGMNPRLKARIANEAWYV